MCTVKRFTCRRSMKASWRVSPWNPGTGSELANTGDNSKCHHVTNTSHLMSCWLSCLFAVFLACIGHINNSLEWNTKIEPHQLTFALDDIEVELLNGPHADLLQLCVEQHLHQGRGQMLAGRHAGRLRHFTLRREGRSGGRSEDNEGKQMRQRKEGWKVEGK